MASTQTQIWSKSDSAFRSRVPEPRVFKFYLSVFEESMIGSDWDTENRFEELVQKEKHTTNLVEAFMERYS